MPRINSDFLGPLSRLIFSSLGAGLTLARLAGAVCAVAQQAGEVGAR